MIRVIVVSMALWLAAGAQAEPQVVLTMGADHSSGGDPSYIVTTPAATYYLDQLGGGLSSLVDRDGVDWLGFKKAPGSGWKGEYRGFPNAVHRQDGSYFHAMNATTERAYGTVVAERDDYLEIVFTSANGRWQGRWQFFPERCDFTMRAVSPGYHYWVLYEGVPGGEINETDYWFGSMDDRVREIHEPFSGDLPGPEWVAFGDSNRPRVVYLAQHQDDRHLDEYYMRPYMTVFGFGRNDGNKYLSEPRSFSIGFIESTNYSAVRDAIAARVPFQTAQSGSPAR